MAFFLSQTPKYYGVSTSNAHRMCGRVPLFAMSWLVVPPGGSRDAPPLERRKRRFCTRGGGESGIRCGGTVRRALAAIIDDSHPDPDESSSSPR